MKAAILGAGKVGTALAGHLLKLGHTVAFGVRDLHSSSVESALMGCVGATASPAEHAVRDADWVFLALPWAAALPAVAPLASVLAGKVVVDCTNAYEVVDGCVKPAAFPSAAQLVQEALPAAKVVKAFNHLGAAKLAHPTFADGKPWMGVAGDDEASVLQMMHLASAIGFDAVRFGKLSSALMLEDMARIWIHAAYVAGIGPHTGFALLRH